MIRSYQSGINRLFTRQISSLVTAVLVVTVLLTGFGIVVSIAPPASAQTIGASGLPLPRFVSLKANRVNMRVGPGRDYQVQWLYVRKYLPMEVIREFGNWRKVRDPNGVEGWVLHSLLSSTRVAIVTPWDMTTGDTGGGTGDLEKDRNADPTPTINLYDAPTKQSKIIAKVEAGKLAIIDECANGWCELVVVGDNKSEITGYIYQALLWGVYPDENAKN